MSCLGLARAAAIASAGILVGLVACTSEPEAGPASYCSAAKAASPKCKEPTACDATLTTSCASLDEALSASTLVAARDCLESGICGAESCLSRAQKVQ